MKTLLVERPIECPNCGRVLHRGDIMFEEENHKITCGYCHEDIIWDRVTLETQEKYDCQEDKEEEDEEEWKQTINDEWEVRSDWEQSQL